MAMAWRKILDEIAEYEPGKPIEEVKRLLKLDKVIKLASNENPIGASPKVIYAITEAAKDINRYPDPWSFYLKKALCKKLKICENNIITSNGSDELIGLVLRAFLDPGDEVIVSSPTFLIYKIAAMIAGASIRIVPAKDLKYDLDAIANAITPKTRIIFIDNPDNPTGTYVTEEEFDDFLKKVPDHVLIFLDEAYYEYAQGDDYPETLNLIKQKNVNVIITRTFSKAYGLAGLRVGYGMARPDIIRMLNKVREPFNVNSLAQVAAVAALEDEMHVERSVALVREEKKRFYRAFESFELEYVPSRTNFVLVDTKRDSMKFFMYLVRKGVIVREMSMWELNGFIRVTVGSKEENDMFLEVFEEALKAIKEKA